MIPSRDEIINWCHSYIIVSIQKLLGAMINFSSISKLAVSFKSM